MFPTINNPAIAEAPAAEKPMWRSFLFDFEKGDFVLHDGKVVETDDISVWVEKVLRTEKYRYKIYDGTNYGCQIEDLVIGANYDASFLESELKREIEDALRQHPQITGISNFEVERTINGANITLGVDLVDQRTDTISITF